MLNKKEKTVKITCLIALHSFDVSESFFRRWN